MSDDSPQFATVLVVEDEEKLVELYQHWLGDDYEVLTAYDGDEALDLVSDDIDVVVLDRRLPTVRGDEVLRTIKDEGYDISVVMVTAVDADLDVAAMPFDDYVEKPVTRQVFLDAVARMVRLQDAPSSVRRYHSLERRRDVLRTARAVDGVTDTEAYERLTRRLEAAAKEAGPGLSWLDRNFYGVNRD